VLVHEAPYVVVTFVPSVPCVRQTWMGFATSHEFREVTLKVAAFLHEQHAAFPRIDFLIDAREIGPLLHEDMQWAARIADPLLHAVGMRRIAFVRPDTALGREAIRAYQAAAPQASSRLDSRLFSTAEEAIRWLQEPLAE
jgi:hypothetical protein